MGLKKKLGYSGTVGDRPKGIKYPGNDPAKPPGEGFIWIGKRMVGFRGGHWFNPRTRESWYPDIEHPEPIGPHWDYTDPKENEFRVFADGRIEPKSPKKKKKARKGGN